MYFYFFLLLTVILFEQGVEASKHRNTLENECMGLFSAVVCPFPVPSGVQFGYAYLTTSKTSL